MKLRYSTLWAFIVVLLSACGPEGTRIAIGDSDFIYSRNISAQEADNTVKFLRDSLDFFSGEVSLLLEKDAGRYLLKMVSKENTENQSAFVNGATTLCWALSEEVFGGLPVDFAFLSHDYTIKRLLTIESPGEKYALGNVVVYSNSVKELAMIQSIVDALSTTVFESGLLHTLKLEMEENILTIKYIDQLMITRNPAQLKAIKTKIEQIDLGQPFSFQFTDQVFGVLYTVEVAPALKR